MGWQDHSQCDKGVVWENKDIHKLLRGGKWTNDGEEGVSEAGVGKMDASRVGMFLFWRVNTERLRGGSGAGVELQDELKIKHFRVRAPGQAHFTRLEMYGCFLHSIAHLQAHHPHAITLASHGHVHSPKRKTNEKNNK